ncbi:DUF128 domain-containing protein [Methanocalculus sp.]|uniref:DUF128 domain-containing protein n=1 Tax=Methanocalculus sp. TaxID=2004547 RepID=UPI0027292870|nr:NrpR regulatory domain-containing protein [Methanocalculus sp.]MDO8842322.1 NrpR regulatory domain-containing protein [Methanocalculus sp.]
MRETDPGTERKCLEILRILRESREPMGAKHLSELMGEQGFILSDRAVQYYLQHLDEVGFTRKVGNRGRVLTSLGIAETESALVGDRIGFVISKLERLAFRSTLNPETCTGDVAYNLTFVKNDDLDIVCNAFDEVCSAKIGFFGGYSVTDNDPRIPKGHTGLMTICSITMDGVFQHHGIPVKMAYGGCLSHTGGFPDGFLHLISYIGTTLDPLQLFISAEVSTIGEYIRSGNGVALANIRNIPTVGVPYATGIMEAMRENGFHLPVTIGSEILRVPADPYQSSIISYSGMNLIGRASECGISMETEIGAGTIPISRIISD